MLRKAKRPAPESSRDAAPASRLSYYATMLPGKESWYQTPEGYRIYKDVPICRTGSQQYLGREIKKNPGYKAEWGIGEDELVTVYRPIEEVTAPETIASFEIKSVLDEHPPDPKILIDALDEYEGVTKGAVGNVRVGQPIDSGEFAGETPLLSDLTVKHPDLNVKVDDGVRDVSCGYTFRLDKDSSGRYIQRHIRGNHVAIVPKGRAGADVGIKDAAPKLKIGRITMSNRLLVALGLQAALKDAKPDEVAGIVDAALEEEKEKEEKKGEKDCVKDPKRGAKDAKSGKLAELRKLLDEYLEEEEEEPEHGAKDKKKAAKDADEFGDDEMADAEEESEGKEDKEREKQSKEAEKDKKGSKDEKGAIVLPADEHSESNFSTGDAASLVSMLRPLVARSGDKAAKDAFTAFSRKVKTAQSGAKDAAADPFALLANITADGAAADSEPEIPMYTFFNGKSHAEGLKAWNEYQAARAAKRS
jgi:hypothetical protein